MTPYEILVFLWNFGLNSGFWWAWEALALFLFYMTKWSRTMGCDLHIVLQWTGNGYRKVAQKWVKKVAPSWGKKKGRINQAQATAWQETGFLSDHGVQFTDMDHTLPMIVKFEVVKNNLAGQFVKKADGTLSFKEGKDYSVNPSVKAMEMHLGEQTAKHLNIANSIIKPQLGSLVMIFALGALAMYVLYPYLPRPGIG